MSFFRELLSDSGAVSFGRMGALVALAASCLWVSWVVYKTSALPDLGGVALFIGTLYGLSKAGETVQWMKGE